MNKDSSKLSGDFFSLTLSDGIPEFKIGFGDDEISLKSKKPLQLNQWHQIKVKKDKSSINMNVNGGRTIEVSSHNTQSQLT